MREVAPEHLRRQPRDACAKAITLERPGSHRSSPEIRCRVSAEDRGLRGLEPKVILCCAELFQIGLQCFWQTYKPSLFFSGHGENVAELDHVCRHQVADVDPNILFLNAGDPADVLHHLDHHTRPLILGPTGPNISTDPNVVGRPQDNDPHQFLRSSLEQNMKGRWPGDPSLLLSIEPVSRQITHIRWHEH